MKFKTVEKKTCTLFTEYTIDEKIYPEEVKEIKDIFDNENRTSEDIARAEDLLGELGEYNATELNDTTFEMLSLIGYDEMVLVSVPKEKLPEIERILNRK